MPLKIEIIPVSELEQNCRIVSDPTTKRAVVFDPGADHGVILAALKEQGLQLEAIYLTHSHFDHCGAVLPIKNATGVPLFGHAAEEKFRKVIVDVAKMYGFPEGLFFNCPEPDVYCSEGMELEILGVKTKIFETPGHSPGSISFWMPSEGLIFSGDVLFKGSIGRSDLPGGEQATLFASIERLIGLLPPETKVLPGHGPDTTIEREKNKNPFINIT